MATYKTQIVKGDYNFRQITANKLGAVAYVEHHFNSTEKPTLTADYAVTIVGRNASAKSIEWGKLYSHMIDSEFTEITRVGGVDGVLLGGYGGRGDGNLILTQMPAILVEPMFCNDPEHAKIITSADGQMRLAKVLTNSIRQMFPDGGLIALSIGHKYKRSQPDDRGALIVGGGGSEADCAELVILKVKNLLENNV